MQSANAQPGKMTSAKFSEIVMDVHDLYNLALRNGYFLPSATCSAVNEHMLLNVLQKTYWCPKYEEIRMKPCPRPPTKEVLLDKLQDVCVILNHNAAWIDDKHTPDRQWLVSVLATFKPEDEIFKKGYVAPPVRKRLQDIETIVLPTELFADMPKSTSKAKARRLKVMSEAFAMEKTSRLKKMRADLNNMILEQEVRAEAYHQKMKGKTMAVRATKSQKDSAGQ